MTDRPHSCKHSADGKHHFEPLCNPALDPGESGIDNRAIVLCIRHSDKAIIGRSMLVCVDCGARQYGEEVPVPEEIVNQIRGQGTIQ